MVLVTAAILALGLLAGLGIIPSTEAPFVNPERTR